MCCNRVSTLPSTTLKNQPIEPIMANVVQYLADTIRSPATLLSWVLIYCARHIRRWQLVRWSCNGKREIVNIRGYKVYKDIPDQELPSPTVLLWCEIESINLQQGTFEVLRSNTGVWFSCHLLHRPRVLVYLTEGIKTMKHTNGNPIHGSLW